MSDETRPDAANGTPNRAENNQSESPDMTTPETAENAPQNNADANTDESADGDAFPREYVETLRKESAGYRDRAKTADERADALAKRLHRELVSATNRLENPDDLPFNAEHLDDADKLSTALDALLTDRPYFAKRKVGGDAGQGPRGAAETGLNLLALMKGGQ